MTSRPPFSERAEQCQNAADANPIKIYLLQLMVAKKTNLCLSADVTSTSALLRLADTCGPYICMLKTHADIIDDFGPRTVKELRELSRRHKFLIFEDRKFGDIGSTVQAQYARGPLQIATWAHIVNAHVFPGPDIVKALRQAAEQVIEIEGRGVVSTEVWVGTPEVTDDEHDSGRNTSATQNPLERKTTREASDSNQRKDSIIANTTISQTFEVSKNVERSSSQSPHAELQRQLGVNGDDDEALQAVGEPPLARALLLFAQMSSEGNLMDEQYTKHSVNIARDNKDFVIGYIAQRDLNTEADDKFLTLTPGIQLPPPGQEGEAIKGDGLGQQYRTPAQVIGKDNCDVAIVGRGIISAKDKAAEAQRYRDAAWKAYLSRLA